RARPGDRADRRARRPGDAALRLPDSRARSGARREAAGGSSRPPLRRAEDGLARPSRPRLLEGGGGPPGAEKPAGLEGDPEHGAGFASAAAAALNFEGLSVLVTGGSRGIGREVARHFAELGAARVAIGYLRNDCAAEETAEELRSLGAEPVLVRGNVASEKVTKLVAALGPLDVLVHNAATGVIEPAL